MSLYFTKQGILSDSLRVHEDSLDDGDGFQLDMFRIKSNESRELENPLRCI